MIVAVACAVAAAWIGVICYVLGCDWRSPRVSPDGLAYLAMARGERQPISYHARFLLPLLLRENLVAWRAVGMVSLVVTAGSVAAIALTLGLSGPAALFAAVLFVGLPTFRVAVALPVLVDAPAWALTALAVLAGLNGWSVTAMLLVFLGAAVCEKVPLFAAAATLNPFLLFGCVVTALRLVSFPNGSSDHPSIARPFSYAREKHGTNGQLLDLTRMAAPWGVCLAALWAVSVPLALSLALAYAFLFVAADTNRMTQWAFLPMCVGAASVVPDSWLVPVAVLHVLNPLQGDL